MLARLLIVCTWIVGMSACGTIKNNNKGGADANPASTSCVLGSAAIGQCTLG
jgi:hypothetical protein